MVDLEDLDVGQLRHPPGPAVQASTNDHQLWRQPSADGIVDGDCARHDHLGAGPYHLELEPLAPTLGRDALTYPLYGDTLVVPEQRHRDRVSESALGDTPVRSRATLAHHHRGTTAPVGVHGEPPSSVLRSAPANHDILAPTNPQHAA